MGDPSDQDMTITLKEIRPVFIPNVPQEPLCDNISVKISEKIYPLSKAILFTTKAWEFTPIPYDRISASFTIIKKTVINNSQES
jgi:hypothetical protein